jgi:hypothetical protein
MTPKRLVADRLLPRIVAKDALRVDRDERGGLHCAETSTIPARLRCEAPAASAEAAPASGPATIWGGASHGKRDRTPWRVSRPSPDEGGACGW